MHEYQFGNDFALDYHMEIFFEHNYDLIQSTKGIQ